MRNDATGIKIMEENLPSFLRNGFPVYPGPRLILWLSQGEVEKIVQHFNLINELYESGLDHSSYCNDQPSIILRDCICPLTN